MRACEDVKSRAGRVEGQRIRKTRAFRLDLVALRALSLELPDEIVMTIGSRAGRPVRIAARMAQVIQQARIVDAAGLAIERGIGGARDRHRRLGADRGVDARHDHAPKRLPACRREAPSCSIICARRLKAKLLPAPEGPKIAARNGVWT